MPYHETDYRLVRGLRKLVEDRCEFEVRDDVDPAALRRTVFVRAAAARRTVGDAERFEPEPVIAAAAAELGLPEQDVQDALFADLRENHVLVRFAAIGGSALVAAYETARKQAILLRAVRVVVTLGAAGCARSAPVLLAAEVPPAAARRHAAARRRLPHRDRRAVQPVPVGHDLRPAVGAAASRSRRLRSRLGASTPTSCGDPSGGPRRSISLARRLRTRFATTNGLPDEVARLVDRFRELKTPWTVEIAHALLELPGVGLCVPDLVFTHRDTGHRVHFEVLGFWSREAVWRRVDLVNAGLPQPIVFAVSSRLRVSEEVLDGELPGQLYVYKGAIGARAVEQRLDASLARARVG